MNQNDFAAALSEDLRRQGVGFRQAEVEVFAACHRARFMDVSELAMEQRIAEARLAYIRWVVKCDRARFIILYGLIFTCLSFGAAVVVAAVNTFLLNPVGWNGSIGGVGADWDSLSPAVAACAAVVPFGPICMAYGACVLAWHQWRPGRVRHERDCRPDVKIY